MPINQKNREEIKGVTIRLLEYCRANNFAGYDPYDALNSRIFKALPFLNFKLFRLALTQFFKRSPINFRPLFLVPKTQNPKALALFLMAFIRLRKIRLLENDDLIDHMVERLIALRSPNQSNSNNSSNSINPENPYWCWGYCFPWQTRTIIVPKDYANIVCTTFVANALLELYQHRGDQGCLKMAVSSAEYILNELYWEKEYDEAGFSYPLPKLDNIVHNANFLGSALLSRLYHLTGEVKFLRPALKAARYSAAKQRPDGSWDYGEAGTQAWVDNFHTGYNLCALQDIAANAGTDEFEFVVKKGFEFYVTHFFQEDGAPKYFHNHPYPLDVHSVAQSIITLLRLKELGEVCDELALKVFRWGEAHLGNGQGYYFYQSTPYWVNKIEYMRWSQAWMLLALTTLLEENMRNDLSIT
jgi:hypothetical protein